MLFNSLTFVAFFSIVLALWYAIGPWRPRKAMLLVASYLFYAAWNPPFILILWLSTIVDWFVARWLFRARQRRTRRLILLISLIVNLGPGDAARPEARNLRCLGLPRSLEGRRPTRSA